MLRPPVIFEYDDGKIIGSKVVWSFSDRLFFSFLWVLVFVQAVATLYVCVLCPFLSWCNKPSIEQQAKIEQQLSLHIYSSATISKLPDAVPGVLHAVSGTFHAVRVPLSGPQYNPVGFSMGYHR